MHKSVPFVIAAIFFLWAYQGYREGFFHIKGVTYTREDNPKSFYFYIIGFSVFGFASLYAGISKL